MTCRKNSCICCIFCLIFFAAPLAIAITLSYVGVKPRFYIQKLYIENNTSIFMDLKFKRVVAFTPLRYDDLNITLYYGSNRSSSVGYGVVPGFSQGRKKTVHRSAVVEARGPPWEDALRRISGGSMVALVVELTTRYRLKQCDGDGGCSYTKPKTVVVAADVRLNGSGVEVSKTPISLH